MRRGLGFQEGQCLHGPLEVEHLLVELVELSILKRHLVMALGRLVVDALLLGEERVIKELHLLGDGVDLRIHRGRIGLEDVVGQGVRAVEEAPAAAVVALRGRVLLVAVDAGGNLRAPRGDGKSARKAERTWLEEGCAACARAEAEGETETRAEARRGAGLPRALRGAESHRVGRRAAAPVRAGRAGAARASVEEA